MHGSVKFYPVSYFPLRFPPATGEVVDLERTEPGLKLPLSEDRRAVMVHRDISKRDLRLTIVTPANCSADQDFPIHCLFSEIFRQDFDEDPGVVPLVRLM
jgi:hypothetical protein